MKALERALHLESVNTIEQTPRAAAIRRDEREIDSLNFFSRCRLIMKIMPGVVTVEETKATGEERDAV